MIDSIYNALVAHPALFLSLWTGGQYLFGVYAQSLRTPTKDSTQNYVSWFAIANFIAANWIRAAIPKVEKSPNFQDALNLQQKIAGQEPTAVVIPPTAEDKIKP